MATPIYSAKPASKWTENELRLFSIEIVDKDVRSFFGCPSSDLPMPSVSPIIFQRGVDLGNKDLNLPNAEWDFLAWMQRTVTAPPERDHAFVDSMEALLELLHYGNRRYLLWRRRETRLFMCGEWLPGTVDIALMDFEPDQFHLLVLEDKRYLNPHSCPESQIVAYAISAFIENNDKRRTRDLPLLDARTFPAVIMDRAKPQFYKIHVTKGLVEAIAQGNYPPEPTWVERLEIHPNDLGTQRSSADEGLANLSHRLFYLRCFEAFKAFVHADEQSSSSYSKTSFKCPDVVHHNHATAPRTTSSV